MMFDLYVQDFKPKLSEVFLEKILTFTYRSRYVVCWSKFELFISESIGLDYSKCISNTFVCSCIIYTVHKVCTHFLEMKILVDTFRVNPLTTNVPII